MTYEELEEEVNEKIESGYDSISIIESLMRDVIYYSNKVDSLTIGDSK